jgi:hypothetical protein
VNIINHTIIYIIDSSLHFILLTSDSYHVSSIFPPDPPPPPTAYSPRTTSPSISNHSSPILLQETYATSLESWGPRLPRANPAAWGTKKSKFGIPSPLSPNASHFFNGTFGGPTTIDSLPSKRTNHGRLHNGLGPCFVKCCVRLPTWRKI